MRRDARPQQATKTFTHPLHVPWLDGVDRHAAILDYGYGYGYGRTMEALDEQGFTIRTRASTWSSSSRC